MRIKDILRPGKTALSFEFFPAKTQKGMDHLFQVVSELDRLNPAYVSVTYGAGGSTRHNTHDLVIRLREETNLEVVAHLTCIGHTRDHMKAILERYAKDGVQNILALRGDLPDDSSVAFAGDFRYAADLVHFIRQTNPEMGIGVAGFPEGHPESLNRLREIELLRDKVDAGADYIVTQLFFDNADYGDFVDRCRISGIHVPIIAGIMPITGSKNMIRMAELSPRTRFPAALLRSINRTENPDGFETAGIHWTAEQVRGLLDKNVPGIHFYTLNHSKASVRVVQMLGMHGSSYFAKCQT